MGTVPEWTLSDIPVAWGVLKGAGTCGALTYRLPLQVSPFSGWWRSENHLGDTLVRARRSLAASAFQPVVRVCVGLYLGNLPSGKGEHGHLSGSDVSVVCLSDAVRHVPGGPLGDPKIAMQTRDLHVPDVRAVEVQCNGPLAERELRGQQARSDCPDSGGG